MNLVRTPADACAIWRYPSVSRGHSYIVPTCIAAALFLAGLLGGGW